MQNILLGLTGSVASKLVYKLIDSLNATNIVVTERAKYFTGDIKLYGINCNQCYVDGDEYTSDIYQTGSNILHIDLCKQSDVFVVAPCSANTLAKFANGICDNLLTSIFRAWDFTKPVYIAPAMNTNMWLNPITQKHIDVLESLGVNIIWPTVKQLACNDYGIGAMADIDTIRNITNGVRWYYPFMDSPFNCHKYINCIEFAHHPGSFGSKRKHDIHTGVDLYASHYKFCAMESGIVIDKGQYTGVAVGSPWWRDTDFITIAGNSGHICYGEVKVNDYIKAGDQINVGQHLGYVVPVLQERRLDIPYHKEVMLHIELLKSGSYANEWKHGDQRDPNLLDPTPYLYLMNKNK
jgi:phosphopantothenoylcysteine decarboxylase